MPSFGGQEAAYATTRAGVLLAALTTHLRDS
jgi:hypothetical protein